MNKNYRIDIETAKKKYIQIRDLYEVLSECANLEIDCSPLLERHEPALTDYQRAERVEHEFGIDGFITEVHLRRNMLPGEPNRPSAIDEECERQHNAGGAAEDSSQEDAEEQEEEKNPTITNPQWKNADGQSITKALVGDEVTLCADVQDIPDGTSAKIKIVEKDADGDDDDVASLTADNAHISCFAIYFTFYLPLFRI